MATPSDDTANTANTGGAWRDEERLPLADLVQAVGTSADDGQADDLTGNDAGMQPPADSAAPADGDPDPDSEAGRALRTDFTGRRGPN